LAPNPSRLYVKAGLCLAISRLRITNTARAGARDPERRLRPWWTSTRSGHQLQDLEAGAAIAHELEACDVDQERANRAS